MVALVEEASEGGAGRAGSAVRRFVVGGVSAQQGRRGSGLHRVSASARSASPSRRAHSAPGRPRARSAHNAHVCTRALARSLARSLADRDRTPLTVYSAKHRAGPVERASTLFAADGVNDCCPLGGALVRRQPASNSRERRLTSPPIYRSASSDGCNLSARAQRLWRRETVPRRSIDQRTSIDTSTSSGYVIRPRPYGRRRRPTQRNHVTRRSAYDNVVVHSITNATTHVCV